MRASKQEIPPQVLEQNFGTPMENIKFHGDTAVLRLQQKAVVQNCVVLMVLLEIQP